MAEHVQLLLSIPPQYSISQIMWYLKGKNAMMIFKRYANLEIGTFRQRDIILV